MLRKLQNKSGLALLLIFFGAVLVRVWNVGSILEFNFDQGRDGLVIWDFIHKGRLFLIGPTTGIEGIFRGPWYYWLITPFYWLGGGNPVWPAVFLSLTSVVAIYFVYLIGREIGGWMAGTIGAFIGAFSYNLVLGARWLSNPTPMFLISMVLVWGLIKKRWWLVAVMLGMAMQFGSAAEIFYFPAVLVFILFEKKNRPTVGQVLGGLGIILITALPQIIFNFRHGNVLLDAIVNFLVEEESFKLSVWQMVKIRLPFYLDTFANNIWMREKYLNVFLILGFGVLVANFQNLWKNRGFRALVLLFVSPLLGMLFFQGNSGNVYSYYFTGYFLIFVLILSILLAEIGRNRFGMILVGAFIVAFVNFNYQPLKNYMAVGRAGNVFGYQMQTVDWVLENSGGENFNMDAHVPPVIPYSYDYLFQWRSFGEAKNLSGEKMSLLYTVYEDVDVQRKHLNEWLERQKGIGEVESKARFGDIVVERRTRL